MEEDENFTREREEGFIASKRELNKDEKRAIELGIAGNYLGNFVYHYPQPCMSAYCPCIECPKYCPYLESKLLYAKLNGED